MLHAELHGKLDADARDLDRREDILTSTVFGTLLIADDGMSVLGRWLSGARCLGPLGALVLSRRSRLARDVDVQFQFGAWLNVHIPALVGLDGFPADCTNDGIGHQQPPTQKRSRSAVSGKLRQCPGGHVTTRRLGGNGQT